MNKRQECFQEGRFLFCWGEPGIVMLQSNVFIVLMNRPFNQQIDKTGKSCFKFPF